MLISQIINNPQTVDVFEDTFTIEDDDPLIILILIVHIQKKYAIPLAYKSKINLIMIKKKDYFF